MHNATLVTGAGGFIGSHLVEALVARGHRVRAMVHYNSQNNWGWLETLPKEILAAIEVFPADVSDPMAVHKAVSGCNMVFHLAALISIPYSYVAPASYVETNIKGTLNVLQACLNERVDRLVHTSTSETYGTAQYTPIDEGHPLVGQSPYSASKIAADKLAEAFYRSFSLPVATIRPFNTFGPRQSARAIIPTIITQALSGAEVIRLGSLSPVRDLTYVKDVVSGFMAVAMSDKTVGRVTNIGSGTGITICELARLVLNICGSAACIVTDEERIRPEHSEVMQLVCDYTRAKKMLKWQPQYTLREGLKETVDWITGTLHLYKPGIFNI
jgi:NAD dependent epimerase/dehydratase